MRVRCYHVLVSNMTGVLRTLESLGPQEPECSFNEFRTGSARRTKVVIIGARPAPLSPPLPPLPPSTRCLGLGPRGLESSQLSVLYGICTATPSHPLINCRILVVQVVSLGPICPHDGERRVRHARCAGRNAIASFPVDAASDEVSPTSVPDSGPTTGTIRPSIGFTQDHDRRRSGRMYRLLPVLLLFPSLMHPIRVCSKG